MEEKLTELADSAIKGALARHGTGGDRVFGLESRTQTIPFATIVEFTANFSADLLSTVSVRREVGN